MIDCFDDMADRSIPLYRETIELCCQLAMRHLPPGFACNVLDLGVSTGNTLARLQRELANAKGPVQVRMTGVDCEQGMLDKARARLGPSVILVKHDLRERLPYSIFAQRPRVVFLLWTAQFVPIEHRSRLIADIRKAMDPDGALFVAEKLRGQSAAFQTALAETYRDFKRRAGYPPEEIDAKAKALEGALVSLNAPEQKALLQSEGFAVEEVIRYLGFAAWYCLPR